MQQEPQRKKGWRNSKSKLFRYDLRRDRREERERSPEAERDAQVQEARARMREEK